MSAGEGARRRGNQAPCFFSNPLMSDVESDWSPIHDAAFNGRLLALQKLLAQGTCVNLSTVDQVTPLHAACVQGHTACAKLLLENGANGFDCGETRELSLGEKEAIVKLREDGKSTRAIGYITQVNLATVDGHTALSQACGGGRMSCATLLLQHDASPSGSSPSNSPIHLAAAKGHADCMESLVQHGADVDQCVNPSGTPLYVACSNQHLTAAEKLLQLGASVNTQTSGDSPLHIAARLSYPKMVSLLLSHGADAYLRNPTGKLPLDLAPPGSLADQLLRQTRGVPALMQLCRLFIRRSVGKMRLSRIHELHLPTELKLYLLFQS